MPVSLITMMYTGEPLLFTRQFYYFSELIVLCGTFVCRERGILNYFNGFCDLLFYVGITAHYVNGIILAAVTFKY